MAAQPFAEALETLDRGGECGLARQEADPPVTQTREVSHEVDECRLVLDPDGVERKIRHPVEHERGEAVLAKGGEGTTVRIAAGRDDDAVDAPLMQRRHHLQLAFGAVVRVAEQHHHAELGAFLLDRVDHVGDIAITRRRHSRPDRLARLPGQRTREDVGRVADRADRVADRLRGFRAGETRAIDHVRDGRRRYACLSGDVGDGSHRSTPVLSPTLLKPSRTATDCASPIRVVCEASACTTCFFQ